MHKNSNLHLTPIRRALPRPSAHMVPSFDSWDTFEIYVLHVMSLHRLYGYSDSAILASFDFAMLLCHASRYCYERRVEQGGMAMLNTTLEICEMCLKSQPQLSINIPSIEQVLLLKAEALAYVVGIHANLSGLSSRRLSNDAVQSCFQIR